MTSLRVGGLSVAGATGRITGGAGDAATAAVGTGGVGADAGDGAGGALGVATGAAGVTTVAVVTRAPDNGGADEHAAPRNTAHSAVHVVRRVRAEVNVEAIEGDSAMTRGEPLPALGRTLYVVATPIGNLRDITLRALDILGQVDVIAAEDTRVTGVLIAHHGIRAQLLSLNEHNERRRATEIVKLLDAGKRVALVTDAGTPAISDPGAALVRAVGDAGFAVVPVPGPSAVIAALSAAGLDASPWLFFGFLPATAAARRAALEPLAALPYALVFYEAPHRIKAALAALAATLGAAREIVIARELTKRFETIHRCLLGDASAWIEADPDRQRGEFVLIVGAPAAAAAEAEDAHDATLALLLAELPLARAVKLAVALTRAPKNRLYERALALKQTLKPPPR
jgi:16S rRNA (cytidine1402-2'-O)-methyltransferase